MYEVIWSAFNDAYIARPMNIHSTIKALFVGSFDECVAYISKNTCK